MLAVTLIKRSFIETEIERHCAALKLPRISENGSILNQTVRFFLR